MQLQGPATNLKKQKVVVNLIQAVLHYITSKTGTFLSSLSSKQYHYVRRSQWTDIYGPLPY